MDPVGISAGINIYRFPQMDPVLVFIAFKGNDWCLYRCLTDFQNESGNDRHRYECLLNFKEIDPRMIGTGTGIE
jgi:hypothetical protein